MYERWVEKGGKCRRDLFCRHEICLVLSMNYPLLREVGYFLYIEGTGHVWFDETTGDVVTKYARESVSCRHA